MKLKRRDLTLEIGKRETGARRWPCTISTEAPAMRATEEGAKFVEVLEHDLDAIDLSRGPLPVLEAHDHDRVNIGVVQDIHLEGRKLKGTLVLGTTARADELSRDIDAGIVTGLSVGYRILKSKKDRTPEGLPMLRAIRWMPYEVSITGVPVDIGAGIGRSQKMATEQQRSEGEAVTAASVTTTTEQTREISCDDLDPAEDSDLWEELGCGENAIAAGGGEARATEKPAAQQEGSRSQVGCTDCVGARGTKGSKPKVIDLVRRELAADRKRAVEIRRRVQVAGLSRSLADELSDAGATLGETSDRIFKELEMADRGPRSSYGQVEAGADRVDHVRAGVSNLLLSRALPTTSKLDDNGARFQNRSLLELGRAMLEVRGVRTHEWSKQTLAAAALGLSVRAGQHSISDFPNVLADVAGKTLRQAYNESPQTFSPVVRQTTLPDFKTVKRTQLGESPPLELVLEGGLYTQGTIGDGRESYALSKYGKEFLITWEAIVNDDIDAFSRVPGGFGRQAKNLESDLVWKQITSNPTLSTDSTALFHANHGNLAAAGSVVSVNSLSAGRTALRNMKGFDGATILNIMAKYLIVPAALETVADQFISTALLANQASSTNPFAGRLQVIAEPRLDAASAVAWYLAGDPGQVDMIETATLEGEGDGPRVTSRVEEEKDGLVIKARHVFAARVIDYRAFYKNPGA